MESIYNSIADARNEKNKPTIICLRTTIGFGSKQQGTHGIHGSRKQNVFNINIDFNDISIALKADDIQALKSKFGFQPDQQFFVPRETYETYAAIAKRGAVLESEWTSLFSSYSKKYPNEHTELTRRIAGKLPDGWEKALPVYKQSDAAQASRKLSEIVLTAISPVLPDLLGGSADLTGSNLTKVKQSTDFQPPSTGLGTYAGTYIRYGVREHAMGAIANGLSAYGGIIPFVGTFLVSPGQSLRNGRMIYPLNRTSFHTQPVLSDCLHLVDIKSFGSVSVSDFIFSLDGFIGSIIATHDSIGLGEDGPTHQPIETAIHLRAIPNLDFWRPADGNETSAAYAMALKRNHTPSVLSLSRQNLPNLENSTIEHASNGGYVIHEEEHEDLTIVSCGSEVSIAVEAAKKLKAEGIKTRVVSLPCWSVFDQQSQEYRLSILRSGAPILSLEALSVCESSLS